MIILKSSDTQVTMTDLGSIYTLPNNQPVVPLICEPAFNNLTPDEKLYTHYLSRASWHGSLIIPFQISPEAPLIIALLLSIFYYDQDVSKLKKNALANNVSEDEFQVSETPIILKNKEKFELNFFFIFFPGIFGLQCRYSRQHGKLQIIRGHKVHPEFTIGKVSYNYKVQ